MLLIDESGVTLSFQGLPFKVARHCVRRGVRDVESQEILCDDVFEDLCRSTPSVEEPAQPPNPPLDSLDLYKRKEPPVDSQKKVTLECTKLSCPPVSPNLNVNFVGIPLQNVEIAGRRICVAAPCAK